MQHKRPKSVSADFVGGGGKTQKTLFFLDLVNSAYVGLAAKIGRQISAKKRICAETGRAAVLSFFPRIVVKKQNTNSQREFLR